MPITVEWRETQSLIRFAGDVGLSSATELRGYLRQCLESGKDLVLELKDAEAIDVSILQLLWAAGREGTRAGIRIHSEVSEAALNIARDAGFPVFPIAM